MKTEFRKWLAWGTGVGIEIGDSDLRVAIARARPSGIAVLGSATVPKFRERPAAEWGDELSAFLRKSGCAHIAASVLLPRHDVIVRQTSFPGVRDKDLEAAIALQIDGLHPFAEDEAAYTFARIGGTHHVLVGITRREIIDRYLALFGESGIKVRSFTFSAASLYSALRVYTDPPHDGFLAIHETAVGLEVYGESPAKPVFSATFDAPSPQAISRAISELRLPAETEPAGIEQLLPAPTVFPADHDSENSALAEHALTYAAAVASATPLLSLDANLLPVEQRRSSSRLRLVPTAVLASILVLLFGALAAHSGYEERRYLAALNEEIRKLDANARKADAIDRLAIARRARAQLLDGFRVRSKQDMDAINEITRVLPPPTWLNGLEITRTSVQLSGEAEQAAPLLKTLDSSPYFENSEPTMPFARSNSGEIFRIRTAREANPSVPQQQLATGAPFRPVQEARK